MVPGKFCPEKFPAKNCHPSNSPSGKLLPENCHPKNSQLEYSDPFR